MPPDIDQELRDRLAEMDAPQFVAFAEIVGISIGDRIGLKKKWEEVTGLTLDAAEWCELTGRPPPKPQEPEEE